MIVQVTNQNTVPLMDLVAKFRHAAAHLFIDHMKRQRDQLIAFLKDAGTEFFFADLDRNLHSFSITISMSPTLP